MEKSRVPGVRFVEGKGRPNRVFGAFRPHSKVWYAKSRGCVVKVLAAGNGGRRIIPAMFHAMRLTACAR